MSVRLCPDTGLRLGDPAPALDLPHFPTRYQAVLWRNWGCATPARLARVLHTTEAEIATAADALGLGQGISAEQERLWLKRGYITLIRQNWHLLPYPQLLVLIDRTADQLAYALREDDFLWNKLGRFKPDTDAVKWAPLTPEQETQTAALRQRIEALCGPATQPGEHPFAFLKQYGRHSGPSSSAIHSHGSAQLRPPVVNAQVNTNPHSPNFDLKFVYSYSAVYGDPLLDPELDPYPGGLLADLAANEINAIWLQGVLYTLIPWFGETPYSKGHETRIANLNALVDKAARHGIGVYLYINEPRAMEPAFYERFPDWKGPYYEATDVHSMCISHPEVLQKLQAGMAELFTRVPGLAGVFTITLSENLTHCHSKSALQPECPRCRDRNTGEIIAEVNNAIVAGVHSVKPEADVLAWSWAWYEEWWKDAIDNYRTDLRVMCTSESFIPTEAMGVKGIVSDYSISRVGPGHFSSEVWKRAAGRGLDIAAKVQLNNTWECSAVPYIPVPFLVKQHLRNLKDAGISGLMASWTLGGYPGGNLALTEHEPEDLAIDWFGPDAAEGVLDAWRMFGEAFPEFPFNGAACLYTGPQNYGPMNLLFAEPSGRTPTMVGFPYDGLDRWRGNHFPPEVFEEQFRKLSEGWGRGLERLKQALERVPEDKAANAQDLLDVAETVCCHFRTTYLQIRFIRLRDGTRTPEATREIHAVLDEEIELARRLIPIVRRDSRIGFEASNHYYYTENALKEKILNCDDVRKAF